MFGGISPAPTVPSSLTLGVRVTGSWGPRFPLCNPSPNNSDWTRSEHLIQMDQSDSFSQYFRTEQERPQSVSCGILGLRDLGTEKQRRVRGKSKAVPHSTQGGEDKKGSTHPSPSGGLSVSRASLGNPSPYKRTPFLLKVSQGGFSYL